MRLTPNALCSARLSLTLPRQAIASVSLQVDDLDRLAREMEQFRGGLSGFLALPRPHHPVPPADNAEQYYSSLATKLHIDTFRPAGADPKAIIGELTRF